MDSYLNNRYQSVVLSGVHSLPKLVTSGVPQGSHLGPLLFLLYTNDLAATIKSSILMYADDVKLYRIITGDEDRIFLQQDLNNLARWCDCMHMNLNIKKVLQ